MILVDTSVIIDSLRGVTNNKADAFRQILARNEKFCISAYTYLEL